MRPMPSQSKSKIDTWATNGPGASTLLLSA